MKSNIFFFFTVAILFTACSKKTDSSTTPPVQDNYLNTTSGSTWTYHENNTSGPTPVSSDYILTSTSKDSTINTRSYHVYTFSYGGSQYLNISGHDYYQFDSLPGGLGAGTFERLYLKDDMAVGGSWTQTLNVTIPSVPLPLPVTVTNTIAEKGISRTVNGINYTNVIHVSTAITSVLIPAASLTSSIDSYYAPKYGLIENTSVINLNYLSITQNVNLETKLVSAVIK